MAATSHFRIEEPLCHSTVVVAMAADSGVIVYKSDPGEFFGNRMRGALLFFFFPGIVKYGATPLFLI